MTLITRIRCGQKVIIAGDRQINYKTDRIRKGVTYQKVKIGPNCIYGLAGLLNDPVHDMNIGRAVSNYFDLVSVNWDTTELFSVIRKELKKVDEIPEAVMMISRLDVDHTLFINGDEDNLYYPTRNDRLINVQCSKLQPFVDEFNVDWRPMCYAMSSMQHGSILDFNSSLPILEGNPRGLIDIHPNLHHSFFHLVYYSMFGDSPICERNNDEIVETLVAFYDFIDSLKTREKKIERKIGDFRNIRTVGKCGDINELSESRPKVIFER